MVDVNELLDRAKAKAGVTSDYALAVKVLGYKEQTTLTNWRKGRSRPDARALVKLCELTGDDAGVMAARLQADRAANDEEAGLWRAIAKRLAGGHHVIALALVALVLGALSSEPARAAVPHHTMDVASVCILCQMVYRLILQIGRRLTHPTAEPAAS